MLVTPRDISEYYVRHGMSDAEIAKKYGVCRTTILRKRCKGGIKTREYTGKKGEKVAIQELVKRGFEVEDMNQVSMTYPFDLLVNGHVKIDVKSSNLSKRYNWFEFALAEKPQNGNIESDIRIRLKNGRMRKLYDKTCDIIMLVGLMGDKSRIFMLPSNKISSYLQKITIPYDSSNSKYAIFENRWDFLFERSEGVEM